MSVAVEKQKRKSRTPEQTESPEPHSPVMTVTRFEKVSSWLIALVAAVTLAAAWEIAVHFLNRPPTVNAAVQMELIDNPGGAEDGSPDETLLLESPEDVVDDPSLAEVESEEVEVEELLENVIDLAETAVEQTNQQLDVDAQNSGNPGRADGTGRRALGEGPGEGGMPRDQRWFIRYGEKQTTEEYARQLDYFGIVLGTIQGNTMYYVSNFSKPKPTVKPVTSTKDEQRLYMTWQGGTRRREDVKLFQKAGINVTGLRIFQFIPKKTEDMLAKLELDYRNRQVREIRRTYFTVRSTGNRFKFEVTKQIYFY